MQAFQVRKIEVPAEWAAVSGAYIGWVEVTDDDGGVAVGAVAKDGCITIPHGGIFSGYTITGEDCAETVAAAKSLFS